MAKVAALLPEPGAEASMLGSASTVITGLPGT